MGNEAHHMKVLTSFISYPFLQMWTLVSKNNGKNYYGYKDGNILEVVKVRGCFYQAKYKHWTLTPVGDALRKEEFTLVENENEETD